MKKISQKLIIITLLIVIISQFFMQSALADEKEKIQVEFFYSSSCGSCKQYYDPLQAIEDNESYTDTVVVLWKDIGENQDYDDEYRNYYIKEYGVYFPFVVVKNETNETIIKKSDLTIDYLESVINGYIAGMEVESKIDKDVIDVDFLFWHMEINVAGLSLPVLTIILSSVDSFNPCAFFILIFLLNLLLYAKTRRRMLLIGGVFIFFSGFLYFLFMFVLLATLTVFQVGIISILVGLITLILGALNVKDFFFFNKGVSLSIPEEKKPELFKKMRNLVKTPQLATAIIGTIFLAATVNFYELLCSLGLPLVFVNRLTFYNLPAMEYYLYIFFYTVIYVIPLLVILLIFVVTLGHRKLTEWHGRILKLFSGIMLGSFGMLFLIDYTILENIATPILLLLFALVATAVISFIWKRYHKYNGKM